MLLSDQIRIIEQAKFTYFPLGKTFKKQVKTIEDQGAKKIKATENRVKKQILDAYQKSVTSLFLRDFFIRRSCTWIGQNLINRTKNSMEII